MARPRHLKNAPITEALIDFRVQSSLKIDEAAAEVLTDRLRAAYVKKGQILMGAINLHAAEPLQVQVATENLGVRFHSTDEKFVAQFQHQGFTISRLAPYTDWEHLKSEAERLWPMYVEVIKPERIVRTACRYINNLNLPMRSDQQFSEFLSAPPSIPPRLPQNVMSFMQRMVIPYPEIPAITLLTQLLEPNAAAGNDIVPVILDIDVQCLQQFDPHGPEPWQCLDRLRELKNAAFFESITEVTAGGYE